MEYDKIIDKLAEKLQVPAEQLWKILIKQAPIDSITSITSIVLCSIFIVCLIILFHKIGKRNPYDNDFYILYQSIGVLSLAVIIVIAMCYLPMIIAGFVNPEYWALKQILK